MTNHSNKFQIFTNLASLFVIAALIISGCSATLTLKPVETEQPTISPTTLPQPAAAEPIPVKVWLTTADQSKLLEAQPDVTFGGNTTGDQVIYVNENNRYQQMDGFGASMTDSSAWLIYNQLSEAQRNDLMRKLFSPFDGIGISITRIPMGASDFVNGAPYTYDDMPAGQTDPELAHFSIEHDQTYIIPALQQALKINPSLKIMASPWSAPAWMKDSDSLLNGTLRREYYDAYAQYFIKFIQAYEDAGLPIYAITLQNEPHFEPNTYPGMRLEPQDEADFVKDHLGPAFTATGINTKILIWDHNWNEPEYPIAVLDDPQAKPYISGTAFHCYKGVVISQGLVHEAHPDRDIYFTECSGGVWIPSFAEGVKRDMKDLVMGATRNWARTVIKWNIALDTSNGPHNGGCGNCDGFVKINSSSDAGFTFNYDYYSIGHASKFVAPGAYRIASSSYPYKGLESVVFINPDNSKALIVANTSSGDKTFIMSWGGRSLSYSLPGGAVATFTWDGTQKRPSLQSQPKDLNAKAVNGKVILTWEFSPLADSYNIKRSEQPGGPYELIAGGIGLPEYFDTKVSSGKTYYYVVSSVNELGESANSVEVSAGP